MKFSIGFAVLALPLLATAGPLVERSTPGPTACNQSNIKCCNSVQSPKEPGIATLLGLLGVNADIDNYVGMNCNPITVIGAGKSSCSQQVACCTGNTFNGVINLGCSPLSIV